MPTMQSDATFALRSKKQDTGEEGLGRYLTLDGLKVSLNRMFLNDSKRGGFRREDGWNDS